MNGNGADWFVIVVVRLGWVEKDGGKGASNLRKEGRQSKVSWVLFEGEDGGMSWWKGGYQLRVWGSQARDMAIPSKSIKWRREYVSSSMKEGASHAKEVTSYSLLAFRFFNYALFYFWFVFEGEKRVWVWEVWKMCERERDMEVFLLFSYSVFTFFFFLCFPFSLFFFCMIFDLCDKKDEIYATTDPFTLSILVKLIHYLL